MAADGLLPHPAPQPAILRDDRSAAEPATRAFSQHLPALISALASDTGLAPAHDYPRLQPAAEYLVLLLVAIALAALCGLSAFPRNIGFLTIAAAGLVAQYLAAGSASLWLPGLPALAAMACAWLVSGIIALTPPVPLPLPALARPPRRISKPIRRLPPRPAPRPAPAPIDPPPMPTPQPAPVETLTMPEPQPAPVETLPMPEPQPAPVETPLVPEPQPAPAETPPIPAPQPAANPPPKKSRPRAKKPAPAPAETPPIPEPQPAENPPPKKSRPRAKTTAPAPAETPPIPAPQPAENPPPKKSRPRAKKSAT